jgi:Ca-activated chloride channel family protein
MKVLYLTLTMLLFTLTAGFSQQAHKQLRKGDKNYKEQDFTKAEEAYRRALQDKRSAKANYNLGNAIYRQERFNEAVKQYEEALSAARNDQERAWAYHNLGNALYNGQEYEKSIEAYKNSLRINPNDQQTKYNLGPGQAAAANATTAT